MLARHALSAIPFPRARSIATFCFVGLSATVFVWSADSSPAVLNTPEVRALLQTEAQGKPVDRAAELKALRDAPHASPDVFWASGWVQWNKKWVSREETKQDAPNQLRLADYDAERSKLATDPNADQKLAEWCRQQGLEEQERIHWMRVLESNPNHAMARARLQFERIDDRWHSVEEIRAAKEESQELKRRLLKWMPPLKELIADTKARDTRRRAVAMRELMELTDPEAAPALEVAALQVDDNMARTLVQLIAKNGTLEAAAILARIAVVDAYGAAGEEAGRALRDMPVEFYVPELLKSLSSPISQQFAIYESGNGILSARQLLFRETKDRSEVRQLENVISVDQRTRVITPTVNFSIDAKSLRATGRVREFGKTRPDPVIANAARTKLALESQDQKSQIDAMNTQIEDLNKRIFGVLATATGVELPADPNAWWKWWYDHNELYVPEKPVGYSYEIQSYYLPILATYSRPPEIYQMSCLVAGTLVRTVDGLRAVDQIKPGDMVLAQNIESGELAYKPVLRTTVRPPAPIVRIETEDDTIRATGGHLFWVSGSGWIRARKLEAGMQLHTVHGTSSVKAVTTEEEKHPAYNLIVRDFHTYFVGDGEVLSYDNTPLMPTTIKVPGFVEIGT